MMDVRLLADLFRAAAGWKLRERLIFIQDTAVATRGTDSVYRKSIAELRNELEKTVDPRGHTDHIRENWSDLRELGGR